MSAITPVTSTPANGSSPSGLLTTSNPLVRVQAYLASGAADLFLIQKFESGDWCKVPHAVIRLDSNRPDGNSGQILVPNPTTSTSYHVLQEGSGSPTVTLTGCSEPVTVGDLSLSNVAASGTLAVTGAATLSSTLAVTGASTLTGNVSAGGTLAVTGATTLTGLLTANGDVLLGAAKVLGFGAPQALSGAGACNVTTIATLFTSTGAAQALTLADGTRAGQIKFIAHVVDGGSGVLTPTTKTGFSTVTLTNVNDWAALIWSGSAWFVLAYSGATIA